MVGILPCLALRCQMAPFADLRFWVGYGRLAAFAVDGCHYWGRAALRMEGLLRVGARH